MAKMNPHFPGRTIWKKIVFLGGTREELEAQARKALVWDEPPSATAETEEKKKGGEKQEK